MAKRGPKSTRDWDGLFARPHTRLVRGEDYNCSQSAMAQTVRNEASKRRVRVRLVDDGESITVEVRGATVNTPAVAVAGEQSPALA